MSSLYIPAQITAALIRRVVSALALSQQYLVQPKSELLAGEPRLREIHPVEPPNSRWRSLVPNWPSARRTPNDHVDKMPSLMDLGSSRSPSSDIPCSPPSSREPTIPEPPNKPPNRQLSTQPAPSTKPEPATKPEPNRPPQEEIEPEDIIHKLLANPALFDPLRAPRSPIVLCHGLYGFDRRGPASFPSMRMHYWANVLSILRRQVHADVIVTSVPGTGSIASRSQTMHQQLQQTAKGQDINFLAHSMGGLDCRYLISHVKPTEYNPLSLTTISTPHRGSPFMDWCAENIGIGKLTQAEEILDATARKASEAISNVASSEAPSENEKKSAAKTVLSLSALSSLPSSFTTMLLSILDSPAYANLTTSYLNNVFNPATPNDPRVKYFSVAGRMSNVNIWHPFWLPKMVLDGAETKQRKNMKERWERAKQAGQDVDSAPLWDREEEWGHDGLVTVQSAKWGEFLGIMEGCDHWEMRGARGIEFGVDLPAIPAIGLDSAFADSNGDSWGWLVKAWRTEEKIRKDAETASSEKAAMEPAMDRKQERERQRSKDDEVVKSSTDKLSAVFDWISEQVPATALLGSKAKATTEAQAEAASRKKELAGKADLERFYIALCRKLYDEGL
ncbi:alpha beta-hydrolase [Mycena floridula]|nr:alpha beta-hydrolase [Mycena floridula]